MPPERRLPARLPAHAEPVALIAAFADGMPYITLRLVIKRHGVRIRDKWRGALMLNLHGGAGKHEAIILRGSGVAEIRILAVTSKRADSNQRRLVNDSVAEQRLHL